MKFKTLLIVLGEPYSIFSEILFKSFKHNSIKKIKKKIILVGSKELLEKQMIKLGFKFKLNEIKIQEINKLKIYKDKINIININYKFKKIFDKISNQFFYYIKNSFETALKLIKIVAPPCFPKQNR